MRLGLLMASAILLCAVGNVPAAETGDGGNSEAKMAAMANPFTTVASLAVAEERAGFRISPLKTLPGDYGEEPVVMLFKGGKMIQLIYEEPLDGRRIVYRISRSMTPDVMNGDYSEYDRDEKISLGSLSLRVKGSEGVVYAAEWSQGGLNYCLLADDGIDDLELEEMLLGPQDRG